MSEELVQAIAVHKGRGTHEEVVVAAALASVRAWLNSPDDPAWEAWMAGRFTKSVRRGTPTQMAAVGPESRSFVRVGEVEAHGFAPMTYEDMPYHLKRMQVSGLERPRRDPEGPMGRTVYTKSPLGGPTVWVNEELKMTTGKMAAQVAHAVMGWLLAQEGRYERAYWLTSDSPFTLTGVFQDLFDAMTAKASVVITDAGLTEVEPDTSTVVVVDN